MGGDMAYTYQVEGGLVALHRLPHLPQLLLTHAQTKIRRSLAFVILHVDSQ